MKKALIDQMMLIIFLFATLIILGATVADNAQARNTYYKLKSLTDNAVLTMAKYYTNIEQNQSEAEDIADEILSKTKLGESIKDSISYTWNLSENPATVTATIEDYVHENFWYKFLDLKSFTLKATSTAEIQEEQEITSTTDLLPFGINGCDDSHLIKGASLSFDLRGYSAYAEDDYTTFYGIDLGNACSASGNSNWAHFKNEIKNFYVDEDTLKTNEELLEVDVNTDLCIPTVSKLSMEQDNDPKQISQSFKNLENFYDLVGVQADIALFECNSTADDLKIEKFIKVEFNVNPSETYSKVKNDYDEFQFNVKIIGSTLPSKVVLIK